uniref:Uncharacterized protein n=1 Tax=Amphimedon queenslandica TaxID=400682 RepID=A0A1X7TNH0_AMPQE
GITGRNVVSETAKAGKMLNEEMWNRSVVVPNFANVFINLDNDTLICNLIGQVH